MHGEFQNVQHGSGQQTAMAVQAEYVPAGFWIRFVAAILDSLIVTVIQLPLAFVLQLGMVLTKDSVPALSALLGVLYIAASFVVPFLFIAWFYRNKGATPGKLLFNLRVIDNSTGEHLTYGQTFLRDYVGKFLCMITLCIGFIMAGLRSDKRGLHDMVAGTQVIKLQ